MVLPWPAIIAGGVALGGSLLSGLSGKKAQKSANEANWYQQLQAQQWQTFMSNTAHQREVADLKKAGINPLFTATGGNGASTGSVGIGNSMSPASMDYGGAVSSAFQKYLESQQLKNQKQAISNETSRVENQNKNDDKTAEAIVAKNRAEANLADIQYDALSHQLPSIQSASALNTVNNMYEFALRRAQLNDPKYFNTDYNMRKIGLVLPQTLESAKVASGLVNSASFYHHATHRNKVREFSNGMRFTDNYY